MTYTTPGNSIIHEILNDEVIIANLNDGIYYSLRESGIVAWQLLLAGYELASIESLFFEKYGVRFSFAPFVHRLLEENLLIETEPRPCSTLSFSWPAEFRPPLFERYDEMKNLLMLDPIHEVDEQGWPSRK